MINGIGIDIVEHERVNLKIASRVLSTNEYHEFEQSKRQTEFLASRFAAKEAVIKATNKKYLLKDIEFWNIDSGKLVCNIENIHVSISHEKKYSVAMAVWEEK